MTDYLIEAKEVTKKYAQKLALDHVSLSIKKGSIYGLLGPNGAGKTTFIRILTQIIAPDSGQILLEGKPIKPSDISKIGYLPEERGLYKKMKVGEQLIYFAQLKGLSKETARNELQFWLKQLDMADWWNKKVEELSKGMQQKVQFISSVVHRPKLIILDEPFSGFDPVNAALIKNEILNLQKAGATIILSTHRMESVEELCNEFSLIHHSKKVLEGTVNDIKHQFKEHLFELVIRADKESLPLEALQQNFNFDLQKIEERNDDTLFIRFKVGEEVRTNEVLQGIMPFGQILSFVEQLPTINDIFIKLVKKVEA